MIITFQPTYFSLGSRVAGTYLQIRVKSGNQSWTGCHSFTEYPNTHIHTHSDWDNWDMPIHLMCTSLGCWRKSTYPEETQTTWRGHTNSTTDKGLQPGIDFSHEC